MYTLYGYNCTIRDKFSVISTKWKMENDFEGADHGVVSNRKFKNRAQGNMYAYVNFGR